MARVARTYRLEPELVLRLEEAAERLGQSLTVFVTRALEQALVMEGSDQPHGGVPRAGATPDVEEPVNRPPRPAPARAPASPAVPMFCCPIEGCDFKVTGAGAYCRWHDRKVKPCE